MRVRIVVEAGRLRFEGGPGGECRADLGETEVSNLSKISSRYDRASGPADIVACGRELSAWLDELGGHGWWSRVVAARQGPLSLEVQLPASFDDAGATAMFEAPWELLGRRGGTCLVLEPGPAFSVWRRLGAEQAGTAVSPESALGVVFMAGSPRNEHPPLDYEAEERAILRATERLSVDLFVDESGQVEELERRLGRLARSSEPPQVVHLSCHGEGGADPRLRLETETGALDRVDASRLGGALVGEASAVDLAVLSACSTGQERGSLGGLTRRLVGAGVPAVLGWAGPVRDDEATVFAAGLYRALAEGKSVAFAVARAREGLLRWCRDAGRDSRDWHLARLVFGRRRVDAIADPSALSRMRRGVPRVFLDAAGRVPVAGPERFVGRRREMQRVLGWLRQGSERCVVIHGVGRQGKSSVAARVVDRMRDTHRAVVLHGHYGARDLIDAVAREFADDAGVRAWAQKVPREAEAGHGGWWRELLEGSLSGKSGPAMLMVIDDFERVLDADRDPVRVRGEYAVAIAELVDAFDRAHGRSRLLFTSRHAFALSDGDGRGLVPERVAELGLPGFVGHEAEKQARVAQVVEGFASTGTLDAGRIAKASFGNAGLSSLLVQLAKSDAEAAEAAVARLEAEGEALEEIGAPELDALFHGVFRALIARLKDGERVLARAGAVFEVPVPERVMERLAGVVGAPVRAIERLRALGIWEGFGEAADRRLAVNGLVGRFLTGSDYGGPLQVSEARALLVDGGLLGVLADAWGGLDCDQPSAEHRELVRLALLSEDVEILGRHAEAALRWEKRRADAEDASDFATRVMAGFGEEPPPIMVLHAAAMCKENRSLEEVAEASTWRAAVAQRVGEADDTERASVVWGELLSEQAQWSNMRGDVDAAVRGHEAAAAFHRARGEARPAVIQSGYLARIKSQKGEVGEALRLHEEQIRVYEGLGDARERAVTLGDIARIKRNKGEVDEALRLHEEQIRVYEGLGDARARAVALGDIARIKRNKGAVDEALRLHEEQIRVYEGLGDARERAVTLGDIARIKSQKGEVDEALRLHEEELDVYEGLGDARSRAVTLGDIARIKRNKGEVDEALRLHEEQIRVYEGLGDARERAVTLGDIARIKTDKGEVDEALRLHEERLSVYEGLGDARERAVTLGDIARIKTDKGEVDEALRLHEERLSVCEGLGDARSRAVTLGDIARIKRNKGEVDEALRLHEEELDVYEGLGDARSRAVTLGDIARIKRNKGEVDEALRLHEEELDVYEGLGDARERAVTLGDIARIKTDKGEVDEALRLHEEQIRVYEGLGDARLRAVTLGAIARIKTDKGEVDEAWRLQQERLSINERLGHQDGIAAALWDLAQLEMVQGEVDIAVPMLERAFRIFLRIGRVQGIALVGEAYGTAMLGTDVEVACDALRATEGAWLKLGNTARAQRIRAELETVAKRRR